MYRGNGITIDGSRLSILCIRLDELVYAHVRLKHGIYAIYVIQRDPGKIFLRLGCIPRTASSPPVPTDIDHILDVGPGTGKDIGYHCISWNCWVPFQGDDGFVFLDVGWKGHAYTSYRMIDDAVDEEGDIGHEFAHPHRIRFLIDGPL